MSDSMLKNPNAMVPWLRDSNVRGKMWAPVKVKRNLLPTETRLENKINGVRYKV